jgi:hypothetical protein
LTTIFKKSSDDSLAPRDAVADRRKKAIANQPTYVRRVIAVLSKARNVKSGTAGT